jgi:hypothetical protein
MTIREPPIDPGAAVATISVAAALHGNQQSVLSSPDSRYQAKAAVRRSPK